MKDLQCELGTHLVHGCTQHIVPFVIWNLNRAEELQPVRLHPVHISHWEKNDITTNYSVPVMN